MDSQVEHLSSPDGTVNVPPVRRQNFLAGFLVWVGGTEVFDSQIGHASFAAGRGMTVNELSLLTVGGAV